MAGGRRKPRKTTEFGNVWDADDPTAMHEQMGNTPFAWLAWVVALEDAEVHLGEREAHIVSSNGDVVMPMLLAVRAMLLGYAVECALKAQWVRRRGNDIIQGGRYVGVKGARDHNLIQLAQASGFTPTPREDDVLRRLSRFVQFAGRYPVAKTVDEMRPDGLTQSDVGFFSRADFRTAEAILTKIISHVSGKKRRVFPRRPRRR